MSYPFSYLICQLRREYTSALQTRLDAFGLTVGLFPYLIYLEHAGTCTPSAMARELHQDNGHITRCLDKLEKLGCLIRTRSAQDGRAFTVSLTEKGKQICREITIANRQWEQRTLSCLSPDQAKQLTALLSQVVLSLRSEK